MEIKFYVVKILAVGCDKRFMWVRNKNRQNEDVIKCVFIDNLTYEYLKEKGVPTGQKIGKTGKKEKI